MLCSTDSADPLAEFSEFNIPENSANGSI